MATEHDTARHQYELYRYCYENGHQQWVERAQQCFNFWRGRQWDPQALAKLNRERRPALTLNVIESLVRSMKGIQRALRNDVRYVPLHTTSVEDARVMDSIWLHTQNSNQFDFLETDAFEKGLIMSRAYYDVRVEFDDSFQGEIAIRGRRSQDIVLDPSVDDYDPDRWPRVYDRRWVSRDDLQRMFGAEKAAMFDHCTAPTWYDYEDNFTAQQMGDNPHFYDRVSEPRSVRGLLLLGQQYYQYKRKDVFVDVASGDTSEVPENWDRNKIANVLRLSPGLNIIKREVKTVRWTVTCEQEVMHDEDSPYKHFTIVPYFPTFVDGVTMGAVESLLDPQQLYNKITSSELHIISTTANSGYKVKAGSLKNMSVEQLEERGASTGFVAELDNVDDLEKITPNSTPQGHDRLSFKADQIMRSLSGVSNQARGFAREDVAGEAIMANQAAQDVNFAGWLSNLHRSKQILATRVHECAKAFYTETRVIQINQGSAFNPKMEQLTLNQPSAEGRVLNDVTSGRFTTTLIPAPSRTTMGEADFKLLLEMRKLGVAIPDNMLIELSPANNKAQIIQMLNGDSNEREQAQQEAEAKAAEAEIEKIAATAEKDRTAAMLNQARAGKFAVETESDPDAAYERVEYERIAAERQQAAEDQAFEREKFEYEKEHDARQLALDLTKINVQRQTAKETAKAKATADAKKPKPKPKAK